MTRPVSNQPIHTISGRRGLPPKASPHWRSIYPGLRVGWLKRTQDTGGRWVAKLALPGNDIRERVLNAADDPPAKADGVDVLTYGQAVIAAQTWAEAVKVNPDASAQPRGQRRRQASATGGPTVADAMLAYVEAKRRLGQADRAGEALTVLQRHMPLPLRALPVAELTPELLNGWLAQLPGPLHGSSPSPGGQLSQGRVDKVRGVLRAALHLAKAPEAVIRQGLSAAAMPRREAPATREVIPTPDEVHRLLAAMRGIDEDLALFMETLALTGTRPSQLAGCRRDALDALNGLLTIPASNKGRGGARKAVRGVTFPIGSELAGRVARQLDHHTGLLFHTARLVQDFTLVTSEQLAAAGVGGTWREVGRIAWDKDQWTRKVRDAVHAADLDPGDHAPTPASPCAHHPADPGRLGAARDRRADLDTSAVAWAIERNLLPATSPPIFDATTARLRRLLEAETSPPAPPVLRVVV